MSELSTVAIKDGHRGHFPHQRNPAEAERADRISRLAGLERVAVSGRTPQGLTPGSAHNPPIGYFDANNQPQMFRERSTVGSASATGSVGGRTTWASGSDLYEADRMSMSEDQDVETSSMGGFSDEAASLVGFGEGARTPARQHSQIGSPAVGKASALPGYLREQAPTSPMAGVSAPSSVATVQSTSSTEQQKQDSRMMNAYDENSVDATPRGAMTGHGPGRAATTEQNVQEHMRQRRAGQDDMDYEQGK
jgi:hypothetical protein